MTAEIRYLFGNLDTRQIVAEFPLSGVSMTRKLNDWGTFRGTMYFDTSGIDNSLIATSTVPGRNFVICERDGVPVWDGIVWSNTYDSQAKVMNMTARSYEAYAEKQIVDVDFIRTGQDQRNIFCDLWRQMQSTSMRNLSIDVPSTVFDLAVPRDLSILASEYKTFASGMSAMADNEDGFDWTIVTTKSNNQYIRTLQIGYPLLGVQNVTSSPLAFDYPGNVLNYYKSSSMSNAGTHAFLLGAGEGSDMVVGAAIQTDLINSGFKRYDVVDSRKDIESGYTIGTMAERLGVLRRPPLTVLKAFLKADLEPIFGSYGLGDNATLNIVDPVHPNGFASTARIVAFEYRPQSDDGVESVELIFQGDDLNDEG
jgi:hypothetical protein